MKGIGTIINVLAVLLGGSVGLLLRKRMQHNSKTMSQPCGIPETTDLNGHYQEILMHALGVSTLFIGVSGTLKGMFSVNGSTLEASGTMLLIITLVLGSVLGEWINIEKWMDRFGVWLRENSEEKMTINLWKDLSPPPWLSASAPWLSWVLWRTVFREIRPH